MTKGREVPRFRYAHPKTLAGKLQRGLGTGFLEALATPREVVHPLLTECILRDPRMDRQLDNRDVYYAELAAQVGLPLPAIGESLVDFESDEHEETYLAVSVLVELARRGSQPADEMLRDYVRWGPFWHSVCWQLGSFATTAAWQRVVPALSQRAAQRPDEGFWEREPFVTWARFEPLFEALCANERKGGTRRRPPFAKPRGSTASLLQPVKAGPVTPIIAELAKRSSQGDLALIEEATRSRSAMTRAIAVSAQFERGNWTHWDVAMEMALRDQHPPYATGIANRAILKAPAEVLVPLAQRWRSSSNFRRRHLAWEILERYATQDDRPWLERKLRRVSATDPYDRFLMTTIAEIVAARFPGEEFPGLANKFDAFTYSYGRRYLAEALAVTDSTFPTTRAFTSLWDCESDVRVIAAEQVSLDLPGAAERMQEMAADQLEEDSRIREVVERRLGTLTN